MNITYEGTDIIVCVGPSLNIYFFLYVGPSPLCIRSIISLIYGGSHASDIIHVCPWDNRSCITLYYCV